MQKPNKSLSNDKNRSTAEKPQNILDTITTYSGLPQLLLAIMKQLADVMDVERASLFLYDKEEHQLWSAVSSGSDIDKISFPADTGVAGYVMRTQELLNIPDAYADQRFNSQIDKKTGFKTRTILCVPVVTYDGNCIGVLQILNKHNQQDFSSIDEKMLSALASQSAVAIENMQLREKEKQMAEELAKHHTDLQQAYLSIENNNKLLYNRLQSKVWRKRIAISFLLLIVTGLGLWFAQEKFNLTTLARNFTSDEKNNSELQDQSFTPYKIETREVTDWLRLKGNVNPIKWFEVVSPISSVVNEIHFLFGDIVTKGQILATLDTTKLQVELRNANSAYISALNEQDKLKNWHKSLDILRAKREVVKARETLNNKQRKLRETKRLYEKGIIARTELESLQNSVKESRIAIISAKESLQSTLSQGDETKLKVADLKLKNAEQKLNEVQHLIEQAIIRSPANGIIFASDTALSAKKSATKKKIRAGSSISQNSPLFAIANFQGIMIESEVSESLILKLKRGQPVKVEFAALPGIQLNGKISFMGGRGSKGSGRGESGAKFKVNVVVPEISDEQRQLLRIGMSATAKVAIYHNENAIVVPFEAVQIENNRRFVWLKESGTIKQRDIQIRSTQADGVEISNGITINDHVLIATKQYAVRSD